ncbi:MAG TPA: prolyl oligopeptidase family serine peptidase [Longimicrobiales bacterium]|nr:prolyl oligopeptidase family serine peptidase [Longimicrobiales bacterium]
MRTLTRFVLLAATMVAAALPPLAAAQEAEDPYLWLEEVEGERALGWAVEQSQATLAELEDHPVYDSIFRETLEILNSDDRIPFVAIMGDRLYNFWQDADHERGIWRRTTWESYLSGSPEWDVVLDIDALAERENVPWSYGGTTCLAPAYRRCMARLSRGGSDAVEIREFDLERKAFVEDGFFLPEAKQSVAWRGPDVLLVASDFGPGSLTESGYARIAKVWRRGTPLAAAETLFEADREHVRVGVGSMRTADTTYHVVFHTPEFFRSTTYLVQEDGSLLALDAPDDASKFVAGDQLVVYLRSPWEVGGRTYPQGSVIATDLTAFLAGGRDFQVVAAPGERRTILGASPTRDYLLVRVLDNVRGQLWRYRREGGEWVGERIPAPDFGSVNVTATDPESNRFFFTYSSYTQPNTLLLADEAGEVREIRSMPPMFDAEGLAVEQLEATSKDGTRVPYFIVHPEDMVRDGENPTLMYGYGGFQIPMTPGYSATTGKAWLERGGVYVVANIRGGGEFGPDWWRSAQKENRQRAYDDFIAVAEDLTRRGITSPARLGIQGGSNGGLLVGAAMTQRPDLFGAVVVQVPLLDMKRYHKLLAGASWVAEYGDPDNPDEWAYIREYSPYQNMDADVSYPTPLIYTTTRDDRVHPGHARKMAAKMMGMGHPVFYYENTEGGHGSGVTPEQRARMIAVSFTYLHERLMKARETVMGERR